MGVPSVYYEPSDVDLRLGALGGLERLNLLLGVEAAVAAVGGCTDNDPPAARGWDCWRAATRRLREIHRALGWEKDDTANFSTIVHSGHRIKIAVANTDDATGNRLVAPTNRSRNGATSDRASQINQMVLPFTEWRSETEPERAVTPGYATWYLCIFVDGDRVRAELSMPTRLDGGYFVEWSERIILISSDEDWARPAVPVFGDDPGPEFEVPVFRK